MSYTLPLKTFKSSIRPVNTGKIRTPEVCSLPFISSEKGNTKPLFALEVLMNLPKNYSPVLRDYRCDLLSDMVKWAVKAEKVNSDFLALKFNIEDEAQIPKAKKLFEEILRLTKKELIVTGANKKELDAILLPELIAIADRDCIFGIAEQDNYREISKPLKNTNHYIIGRTPIDINLAKELNILINEEGISRDRILIDPNMGALGYGLDYGYSIIERTKLAGLDGDETLNMPVIVFAGEESWKSKEARSDDFSPSYGGLKDRAVAWEAATASAVMNAGADILVLWHPEVIEALKVFTGEN
ncbi:MAG: hypothetical protein PHX18_03305 [Candidatus Gastranaerophilales bacterium]|nr:hypothetical protein [Candidatus Gastranaerophilales bacterium]